MYCTMIKTRKKSSLIFSSLATIICALSRNRKEYQFFLSAALDFVAPQGFEIAVEYFYFLSSLEILSLPCRASTRESMVDSDVPFILQLSSMESIRKRLLGMNMSFPRGRERISFHIQSCFCPKVYKSHEKDQCRLMSILKSGYKGRERILSDSDVL